MRSLLGNLRMSSKIDQLLKSTKYSLHHHATPNDHLARLWGRPPRKPKNDTNRLVLINDQGRNPDPYYGHENTARFCARFITRVPSIPPLLLARIRNYRISSPMPSIGLNCTLRLRSRPSSSSNSSRPDFLLLVAPQAIVSSSLIYIIISLDRGSGSACRDRVLRPITNARRRPRLGIGCARLLSSFLRLEK